MGIKLGTTDITKVYKGTSEILKVYKGTTAIYAYLLVSFDEQGGTTVSNIYVYYGTTYGTLPTTTFSGRLFNGWFTASSGGTQITSGSTVSITAAQTLYAQWSLITYTLTADKNGGTGGNASNIYYITTSSTIATLLGSPTKTGYSLANWKWTSSTAGGWTNGTTYATSQNVVNKFASGTLQAQWTANTYTVSFNSNGGTTASPTSKTVTYASTYGTLATTSRAGYTFNGWFTASSGGTQITSGSTVSITAAQTLYAQWTVLATATPVVTFIAYTKTSA